MSQNPPSPNSPYLIVGLGNPGSRFANTRHNAGFMAVDELARRHGLRFSQRQANAEVARGSIEGQPVLLAKPQTYMNNSGTSVRGLVHFYKIPLERVLVVYDDFALPLGTLRIRERGSAGGHNGLESVIRHLGTQSFPRLRIGVDQPDVAGHSHIAWVLGRFTKEEQRQLEEILPRAAEAIEAVLWIGIERAMNIYNSREQGLGTTDDGRRTTDDSQVPTRGPQSPTPSEEGLFDRVRRMIQEEAERE
jgi:peptidyl-tRNA hydrolase, PTH1 family